MICISNFFNSVSNEKVGYGVCEIGELMYIFKKRVLIQKTHDNMYIYLIPAHREVQESSNQDIQSELYD